MGNYLLDRLCKVVYVLLATSVSAWAQVSLTAINTSYIQEFNTLATTGPASTLPAGFTFVETGANANLTYDAGTGSSITGNTYSFGVAGNTERAFGGLRSTSLIPTIGASFINNTGSTITSLAIRYAGEQWRLGTPNRVDRLDFQYSTNATSLLTGTYVDFDLLDFTAPVQTGTPGAINGNVNQSIMGNTISGLSIAPGATFWIRYNDFNSTGSNDGLAIDDFSLTPLGTASCPAITATLSGATTICSGSSANLAVTVANGTSPNSLTYSNGTTNTVVSNYATGTSIPVSPTATMTYSIIGLTDVNGCSATIGGTSQTVTVNPAPSTANAGSSQTIITGNTATLAANMPTIGTGTWSVASGPSTSATQFSSTTSSNATFTPAGGIGDYVLTWTISNAPCTPSSSNVTISVAQPACPQSVTNVTTGATFCTIQAAIDAPGTVNGNTINLGAATYDELVTISKSVTINGQGASSNVTFTGTVPGSALASLFTVAAADVTIQNVGLTVDLSKTHSAIHTTGNDRNNLRVIGNIITPIGTPATGTFGRRNAIAINPVANVPNYANDSDGFAGVLVQGNTVTANSSGLNNSFRAAVHVDICSGIIGGATGSLGNVLTSVNHDVISVFANQGDLTIQNNTCLGGGIQVSDPNPNAGTITIANNTLDGSLVQPTSGVLPTGALMRIRNNGLSGIKPLFVQNNTFQNHRWGISAENNGGITIANNTFTPNAGATDFRHISINSKLIATNSASLTDAQMQTLSGTLTGNTFNGATAPGSGTAIAFLNHRTQGAKFSSFIIGSTGSENTFAASIGTFIRLDNATGPSATGTGPNNYTGAPGYPEYGGNIPPTTMGPWAQDYDIRANRFDVGAGLQLPGTMTAAQRATLETQLFHKPDDVTVGKLLYFDPVRNLTQGNGYQTIQSAIDAANANDVIELAENVFNERATVTKPLTLTGVSQTGTIIDGTGLGAGNGLTLTDGVAGITVANMRIRSFAGSGIYGKNNDNLVVRHVEALSNGERGIYLEPSNGLPLSNVTIIDNILDGNTNRGLWIINGNKVGLTITNNLARNNGLTGLDVSEGTVTGATITSNTLTGNGDAGLSVLGANIGGAANLIANNIVTDNGRFGIEVKSSVGTGATSGPGSLVIENNTVSRTSAFTPPSGAMRDLAGIAIIHRSAAVSISSPETPRGAVVRNNTVTGFVNPGAGDGFGIVVEGVNYLVTGNTVTGNEVGIQEQQTVIGERGRPSGDSPQGDGTDYFDRGNSLAACGIVSSNNVSGNTITDQRRVGPAPFAVTASTSLTSVCVGQPFSLSALVANGNSPYTYQWTASSGNAVSPTDVSTTQATVANSGVQTFTITATDTFGCISSNTVSVTGATGPAITAQPAASSVVCTGSPVSISLSTTNATTYQLYKNGVLLTDEAVPETGIITYFIASAQASDAGSYSVIISGAGACSSVTSDIFSLTVNSVPAATLMASGALSCAQTSVTLTASGGQSYLFAGPGLVSQDPVSGTAIASTSGLYSVTATSVSNGCSSVATTTVTSNTVAPRVSLVASGPITCGTPSVTLTANTGTRTDTYAFSGPDGPLTSMGNTALVSSAGEYTVTATSTNGCTSTTTTTVLSDTAVTSLTLTSSNDLSCGVSSATLTASPDPTVRSAYTYVFGPGATQIGTTNQAVVTMAGLYSVTATSVGNGCSVSATTSVASDTAVPTASITPSSATLTCSSTSVSLTASGGSTYLWDDNTTTAIRNVMIAGTYSVTVTGTNGCTNVATASVVSDTAVPELTLAKSNDISCGVTSATLTANVTPAGSYTYAFGLGATQISSTNQAVVSTGGLYSVTISSTNGCSVTATTNVTSDTAVPAATLSASGTLTCAQTSVTLTAGGGQTYTFSGPGLSQSGMSNTAIAGTAGLYSVTVTSANGCSAVQTVNVTSDNTLAAPDFFTQYGQSYQGGLQSVTVGQNTGSVTFQFSNCVGGTVNWSGQDGSSGTGNIIATTTQPGTLTYTGTCTLNSCTSLPSTVTVTVTAANVVPTVATAIPPQSATVGQAYSYVIPANSFADANGDALTLTVSGLPDGLSFNGSTTAINGIPTTATLVSVTVTATDPGSLSASTTFSFTVSPAPVVVTPLALTLTANPTAILTTGTTTLSATVSGGTTPYSYTFSGPGTITPSGNTASVSGLSAGVQTFTVLVSDATSPVSHTISATVSVTVTEANMAPTVATAIPPQSATVGQGYSYVIPANTFTDTNGDALTLMVSGLPAGLSFDASTTAINGTPSTATLVSVTVTATDPGSLSASTNFSFTVSPAASMTTTAPFAITGVTTISCTPVANRINLSFDPRYAGLTGQPISFSVVNELAATTAAGPYSLQLYPDNPVITLKATQAGTTGEASFTYNWLAACNAQVPGNTAPTVANPIPPQSATVGQAYSYVIPANTFTDAQTPNGLSLSASGLPAGLNLSGSTISGTPSTTVGSPYSVTITATDPGNLSASTSFGFTVSPASSMTSTAPFAITGVTTIDCTPVANRVNLTFNPQYAGLTGQPITFSVVNELAATTAAGPYSLTLYPDNPVITLKATQAGTTGEASFTYNWLAACNGIVPGNTAPTVVNAIPSQSAPVGQGYSYAIPANTFTDAQTPNALVLSASGLPAGLSLSGSTISGTPSTTIGSPYSVTITATDPGNLSASTSFGFTISPASSVTSTAPFAITGVTTVSCAVVDASTGERSVTFNPQYTGVSGQPISFSVVNELGATTASGPYTLRLYTDNPVITLKATQSGTAGETSFSYNWLAGCSSGSARTSAELTAKLQVRVLGNPVRDGQLSVEVSGVANQPLEFNLTDAKGQRIDMRKIDKASASETQRFDVSRQPAGVLMLRVTSLTQGQTLKVLKSE